MINLSLQSRYTLRNEPYTKNMEVDQINVGGKLVTPVASYHPTDKAYNALKREGVTPQTFYEIHDAEAYHNAISASKNPFTSSVEIKSPEELAKGRMFVTDQGDAGATLHGDHIGGIFNHSTENKGFAHAIVPLLTQEGGRRADAFDTVLPKIYAQHGLHTVARVPFNDEYAPKNWNYQQYSKYNQGRPDVNLLAYQHNNYNDYLPSHGKEETHTDFDIADAVQRRSVVEPSKKRFSQFIS